MPGMDETVRWRPCLSWRSADFDASALRCPGPHYAGLSRSRNGATGRTLGFLGALRIEVGYDTRRVFLRMKSIRMNCPSVIVFVK